MNNKEQTAGLVHISKDSMFNGDGRVLCYAPSYPAGTHPSPVRARTARQMIARFEQLGRSYFLPGVSGGLVWVLTTYCEEQRFTYKVMRHASENVGGWLVKAETVEDELKPKTKSRLTITRKNNARYDALSDLKGSIRAEGGSPAAAIGNWLLANQELTGIDIADAAGFPIARPVSVVRSTYAKRFEKPFLAEGSVFAIDGRRIVQPINVPLGEHAFSISAARAQFLIQSRITDTEFTEPPGLIWVWMTHYKEMGKVATAKLETNGWFTVKVSS